MFSKISSCNREIRKIFLIYYKKLMIKKKKINKNKIKRKIHRKTKEKLNLLKTLKTVISID